MNKNRAQSLLELAAMIVLIAATVFIGGPTIIRGINAHFKIWDDSVQDSYKDPLRELPMQIVPLCTCDSVPMGGPGLRCGVSPCPPTERLESILCNPVGCGVTLGIDEEYCVVDPTCCDIATDTDLCGTGGAAPDCPLGERVTRRPCGGGVTSFGCRPDSTPASGDGNPSCVPHCMGSYNLSAAAALANPTVPVICPGDDTGLTGGPWYQDATQGIGIFVTLVGNNVGACNHPPTAFPDNKCETYCANGYTVSGSSCIPPPPAPQPYQIACLAVNTSRDHLGHNPSDETTTTVNRSNRVCYAQPINSIVNDPRPQCALGSPSGATMCFDCTPGLLFGAIDPSRCLTLTYNTGACGSVNLPQALDGQPSSAPCPGGCGGTVNTVCHGGVFDPPVNGCVGACGTTNCYSCNPNPPYNCRPDLLGPHQTATCGGGCPGACGQTTCFGCAGCSICVPDINGWWTDATCGMGGCDCQQP